MTSGDGWTTCAAGHRHWGLFGAAGLLISDADQVVLQHRAPWTHEGDSWGVPGGARNSDETAVTAALREAGEEAALVPADVDPIGLYVDDHIGWAYTTVVARAAREISPSAANAESVSVSWHRTAEVAGLRLHTGFAAAWQHLRTVPEPLYLVLHPALNGPGTADLLARLVETGIAVEKLPTEVIGHGLSRLFPHLLRPADPADVATTATRHRERGQVLVVDEHRQLLALA